MKFAICNELYEGWEFGRLCRAVRSTGYTGLEIAPFTLAPLITEVTASQRAEYRRVAEGEGLQILGLHWLLAHTKGFHITSADPAIRQRTAEYLSAQIHACADLGGNIMVFGSPAARNLEPGMTPEEGLAYAADTLSQITSALEQRDVYFCLEPLTPKETNFMVCAEEAVQLMQRIAHPRVRLHLDVKAMVGSEKAPVPEVIRTHANEMVHFHANDANLRGPGMGVVDFIPIFAALLEVRYKGWVSVEVFDFKPDPDTIARDSLAYMHRCLTAAGGSPES